MKQGVFEFDAETSHRSIGNHEKITFRIRGRKIKLTAINSDSEINAEG